MVRHVILWKLKEMPELRRPPSRPASRQGLRGWPARSRPAGSPCLHRGAAQFRECDLMLDTTFTDAEALKGYSTHPAHVAVANGKVRPYTAVRTCLDFTV